jgi:hypothetical protein
MRKECSELNECQDEREREREERMNEKYKRIRKKDSEKRVMVVEMNEERNRIYFLKFSGI